jgi:epoxyqueuosine reductase
VALGVGDREKDELRLVGGCGRCTRCLDACPTDAFVGPFHLDPQRCISYWTIEARTPIPRALRRSFGNRIFGCDICQEVCPWNDRLDTNRQVDPAFTAAAERAAPPLLEGFEPDHPYWLDDAAFSQHFRKSPIKRARRVGMLRNVCVALGNWGDVQSIPALLLALRDSAPLARGHAAWALGEVLQRTNLDTVRDALALALGHEEDVFVRQELAAALE